MCFSVQDQSSSERTYENNSPSQGLAALVALLPLPQLTGAGEGVVDEEEVGGGVQSDLNLKNNQLSCQDVKILMT